MLSFKEFVPRAPESGHVRVEHGFGCDGTSNPLRIERLSDGTIKAYCFRCNQSGRYSSKEARITRLKKVFSEKKEKTIFVPEFNLPACLEKNPKNFSLEALQWLNRYKIKPSEIEQHKIMFNPTINRLTLPIYNGDELVFFTYRQLIEDGYPKYISYSKDQHSSIGKFIDNASDIVVIVEDLLSAVKVSRVHYVNAFAMMGSNISDEDKYKLLVKHKRFILFLDNDSRQIKIKQGVLKNFFEQFNKEVFLIKYDKDPKELTKQQLDSLFTGVINGV